MATTTNFGWETPDDTDLVKDGALAMRTLGNAIDTSLVDLKGGTTGQNLRKNSNTDMDFVWAGDASNTVIDAEGDLLVGDAADLVQRLAVGTTGQVLTVDTTIDGKIKWATPASSSSGLTLITSTTISSATSKSVDNCFTSAYDNYLIQVVATSGASDTNTLTLRLRASSSDSNANYDYQRIYAASTSVTTDGNIVGTDEFLIGNNDKDNICGFNIYLYSPQKTTYTGYWVMGSGYYSNAKDINLTAGNHGSATSYDGFTILGISNVTGTIRVYGYQNS